MTADSVKLKSRDVRRWQHFRCSFWKNAFKIGIIIGIISRLQTYFSPKQKNLNAYCIVYTSWTNIFYFLVRDKGTCITAECAVWPTLCWLKSINFKSLYQYNSILTWQKFIITVVLSSVYTFHAVGAEHETLGTVAYNATVCVHASSSITYTRHFLTFIDVLKKN